MCAIRIVMVVYCIHSKVPVVFLVLAGSQASAASNSPGAFRRLVVGGNDLSETAQRISFVVADVLLGLLVVSSFLDKERAEQVANVVHLVLRETRRAFLWRSTVGAVARHDGGEDERGLKLELTAFHRCRSSGVLGDVLVGVDHERRRGERSGLASVDLHDGVCFGGGGGGCVIRFCEILICEQSFESILGGAFHG